MYVFSHLGQQTTAPTVAPAVTQAIVRDKEEPSSGKTAAVVVGVLLLGLFVVVLPEISK